MRHVESPAFESAMAEAGGEGAKVLLAFSWTLMRRSTG
jgi:hypothetical protein